MDNFDDRWDYEETEEDREWDENYGRTWEIERLRNIDTTNIGRAINGPTGWEI